MLCACDVVPTCAVRRTADARPIGMAPLLPMQVKIGLWTSEAATTFTGLDVLEARDP